MGKTVAYWVATKMISVLELILHKKRLRELDLLSLRNRRQRG